MGKGPYTEVQTRMFREKSYAQEEYPNQVFRAINFHIVRVTPFEACCRSYITSKRDWILPSNSMKISPDILYRRNAIFFLANLEQ